MVEHSCSISMDCSTMSSSTMLLISAATQAPVKPPRPPAPTREQILAVQLRFQGLTVHLPRYPDLPWWDVALTNLSDAERQIAYRAKKAVGDTHVHLAVSC